MSKDFYLEHHEELKGQPKRTIADYVEANGILVPRRFDSLEEARDSGLKIICRSEHHQDYDGVSGLLESPCLENEFSDVRTEDELKKKVFEKDEELKRQASEPKINKYCSLLKIDPDAFRNEISYSFWEKLGGLNRKIVADSAVKGRYHIVTWQDLPVFPDERYCYTVFENGRIARRFPHEVTGKLLTLDCQSVIKLYEAVRNLGRFDSNHCPILEVQTTHGKDYFLQYHRARDFDLAQFSLDRKPEADEIESLFVLGATSPEGIKCSATVLYAAQVGDSPWKLVHEDASFDSHDEQVFSELMVRKRKVQLIPVTGSLDFTLAKLACHLGCSKVFKPEVSVFFGEDANLYSPEERRVFFEKAQKTGRNQSIGLYVISDGRKAYVKRIK